MSNYNLMSAINEVIAQGTFEEMKALEQEKRSLGDCALLVVRDDSESD